MDMFLNTQQNTPNGFGSLLDTITADINTAAAQRDLLRGAAPALAATGYPVNAPGPSILSRLLGMNSDGTPSAPATAGAPPSVLSQILGAVGSPGAAQLAPQQMASAPAAGPSLAASALPTFAAAPGQGGVSPNAATALAFFQNKGLSPIAAAGLVGGFANESGHGLNTNAVARGDGSDGSNSLGIGQWNGPRAQALQQFAAARGTSPSDLQTQLEFTWSELTGPERATLAKLQSATNPFQATVAALGYERPAGWSAQNPGGAKTFGSRLAATAGLSGAAPAAAMAYAPPAQDPAASTPAARAISAAVQPQPAPPQAPAGAPGPFGDLSGAASALRPQMASAAGVPGPLPTGAAASGLPQPGGPAAAAPMPPQVAQNAGVGPMPPAARSAAPQGVTPGQAAMSAGPIPQATTDSAQPQGQVPVPQAVAAAPAADAPAAAAAPMASGASPIGAGGGGAPPLPGGLTKEALAAMIQNPQTRQMGLRLWQSMLTRQYTFANGPDGSGVVLREDPRTGTVTPVYQAPVKGIPVPAGEVVVSPTNGTPLYKAAPKLELTQIGTDAFGQKLFGTFDPSTGAITPVTNQPAGTGTDASLHGADFLATLHPAIAAQVQAIAEGRAKMPAGAGSNSPFAQKLRAAVLQYKPDYDQAAVDARFKTQTEFSPGAGPSSPGAQITAGQTAIGHLHELSDAIVALPNVDTGLPVNSLLNKGQNAYAAASGTSQNQKNFELIRDKAVEELTKFYRGTGGTEADLKRDIDNLSTSSSPTELNAAVNSLANLAKSKVDALQDRWHNGMGANAPDFPILTQQNKAALNDIATRAGKPAYYPQGQGVPVQGAPATRSIGGVTYTKGPDGQWYTAH